MEMNHSMICGRVSARNLRYPCSGCKMDQLVLERGFDPIDSIVFSVTKEIT